MSKTFTKDRPIKFNGDFKKKSKNKNFPIHTDEQNDDWKNNRNRKDWSK